ncbi:hypothetical protein ACN6LL_005924 [Streptomyces violaceoruber]
MSDTSNVRIRVRNSNGQPCTDEELVELREALDRLLPLTPETLLAWIATEPDAREAMAYKATA